MTDLRSWQLRVKIAEHEAAHAVVAQEMGLTVAWVDINPGTEEGINFTGAIKIPDETLDFERDVFALAVTMAAPSNLMSHETYPELRRFALLEADLAVQLGGRYGYEAEEILDKAATLVAGKLPEIIDLAMRLDREGRVVFEEGFSEEYEGWSESCLYPGVV